MCVENQLQHPCTINQGCDFCKYLCFAKNSVQKYSEVWYLHTFFVMKKRTEFTKCIKSGVPNILQGGGKCLHV